MSVNDPLIGRTLGGVRIDRILGQGGMARVYYGWDERLERPAAIKVIADTYRGDPAFVERFLREARTVASLRHPNILQIYYAGEEEEIPYFVMEYIRGLNLEQLLRQQSLVHRFLPYSEIIRIGRAAGSALDYAHEEGVIHRDVKPSNIILSEDGRVVLADFGLALQATSSTLGQVFGSPHYIAPEQARNSALAVPQSDLYSLGVVLYEMLTGSVPFNDPSPASLALQHMTQEPPRPSSINPNLSPQVDTILLKALAKSPQERYDSAAEMVNALERALKESEGDELPATMRILPYAPRSQASTQPPQAVTDIPQTRPGQPVPRPQPNPYQQTNRPPNSVPPATTAYPNRAGQPPPSTAQPVRRFQWGRWITCGGLLLFAVLMLTAVVYAVNNPALFTTILPPTRTPQNTRISTKATPEFTATPLAPTTQPTADLAGTQTALAPAALPTLTPSFTYTPLPETATPTPVYDLLLVKNGNQSLFVVNNSEVDFPLTQIKLGDGDNALSGAAWGTQSLRPGNCTAIWQKTNKPAVPKGLRCTWVGANLKVGGKEVFWTSTFQFFYNGQFIGICPQDQNTCEFRLSPQP